MYQNYNYYPQQQTNSQPQQSMQMPLTYLRQPTPTGLKGRPVSSIEEARASSIDFDGSIFYFPDLANRRIYTKQINMDGTATLNMYELKEMPSIEQSNASINNFVTREEFESVIAQLKNALIQPLPIEQPQASQTQKQEVLSF